MAHRCTEFHDSTLAVMWYEDGGRAVLIFSGLYVHESEGLAGVDAGRGWFQRAELVIDDATEVDLVRAWPLGIYGGEAEVDGVPHRNGFPLPLRCERGFKIVIEGVDDEQNLRRIEVEGSGATLTLLGRPGADENFPGAGPGGDAPH